MNKDGKLDMDEFILAMHLIDSVKGGVQLPSAVPNDLLSPAMRLSKSRSDSISSIGSVGSVGSMGEPMNLGEKLL